jgi:aromatic-L-amino-acid/L-tryptophan decarboxylase
MRQLDLDSQERLALLDLVRDKVIAYLDALPNLPAYGSDISDAQRDANINCISDMGIPQEPTDIQKVLDIVFDTMAPTGINPVSGGFFGYVGGGGLFTHAVGALLAETLNRYTGAYFTSPPLIESEDQVLKFFCRLMGYDPLTAGGTLTSGGSISTQSALLVARDIAMRNSTTHELDWSRLPKLHAFCSEQTHHSVGKGAHLAGIPHTISVGTNFGGSMDMDALEAAMIKVEQEGGICCCLIATVGTTDCGAVDDIRRAVELAARFKAFLHVDACYGGFWVPLLRNRSIESPLVPVDWMEAMAEVDSITMDPHKSMFLPYGTGVLLVKNRDLLIQTMNPSAHGNYMPELKPHELNHCNLSMELTRPARGFTAWFALAAHGWQSWETCLIEKRVLALDFYQRLRAAPHLTAAGQFQWQVAEPALTVVPLRLYSKEMTTLQLNSLNQTLLELLNAQGSVFVSGTLVDNPFEAAKKDETVYVLRPCIIVYRTHQQHMDTLFRLLEEVAPQAVAKIGF